MEEPARGLIARLPGGHEVEEVPDFVGKAVASGSVDGALAGTTTVRTSAVASTAAWSVALSTAGVGSRTVKTERMAY